jgi:hypothetical protein
LVDGEGNADTEERRGTVDVELYKDEEEGEGEEDCAGLARELNYPSSVFFFDN